MRDLDNRSCDRRPPDVAVILQPSDVVEELPFLRTDPAGVPGVVEPWTKAQRRQLAALATQLDLPPRTVIYREGTTAGWIYIGASGVVKVFRDLPTGLRQIYAFWFPEDIFGLAERGKYIYTGQAITKVRLYRIPLDTLHPALLNDARLQFHFLCKAAHEYREAQRQKIALTRGDAVVKVATFISMLERRSTDVGETGGIAMAMSRSDIANYLGLPQEAVGRAFRELKRRRVIALPDRHTVRVADRAKFDRLVGES
jgi:CRP-like cAMP-binding protein